MEEKRLSGTSIRLSKTENEIIKKVMEKENLKTDSSTIRFIIKEYNKLLDQRQFFLSVFEEHEENKKAYNERLKWATTVAEQNSIMILDGLNTLLFKNKITDCVPVDVIESPVLQTSRELMKSKIAHFKQAKDERLSKKGKRG